MESEASEWTEERRQRRKQRETRPPDFERFMEYGHRRMRQDEYGEAACWFTWAYTKAIEAPLNPQDAADAATEIAQAQSLAGRTEEAESWQHIAAATLQHLETLPQEN